MMKNPFARRGMLGAAIGMAASAKALVSQGVPRQVAGVLGEARWVAPPEPMSGSVLVPDADWKAKSQRFKDLIDPYQRAEVRRQLAQNILGHLPPSVASNHSWAPWFRAQVAARQLEAIEWDRRGFMDKLHAELHRKVFGS